METSFCSEDGDCKDLIDDQFLFPDEELQRESSQDVQIASYELILSLCYETLYLKLITTYESQSFFSCNYEMLITYNYEIPKL